MSHLFTFDSDTLLSIVLALAAACWSSFKAAEFSLHLRDRRTRKALLIIQAAVDETYRTYVQAIKAGRADGKLTLEERRRARDLAKARAFALARREGHDLAASLGGVFLDLLIARSVKRLKRP